MFYIAQAAAKYWVKTKFTEGEFWSPSDKFSGGCGMGTRTGRLIALFHGSFSSLSFSRQRRTGSIVVISSMSSQIYNQSALNEPLRHVSPLVTFPPPCGRSYEDVADVLCGDVVAGLLQLVQGGRLQLGQELGR